MAPRDNGMMTSVWGPTGWAFGHAITFGYPYKIDFNCKHHVHRLKETKKFFKSMGNVLPCKYCRQSYNQFLKELPLTDDILYSRKKLTKWFYDIHNKVNTKLGIPKCDIPSFTNFYKTYESYRAACKPTTKSDRHQRKEKGCTTPFTGRTKKRCIIRIVDEDLKRKSKRKSKRKRKSKSKRKRKSKSKLKSKRK